MQGTVMAFQSIAAQNGASSGPLMANIGEVSLLTNVVNSYSTNSNVTVPISPEPTALPSASPTAMSTAVPTALPSATPTTMPTAVPTALPSATPTAMPTAVPTALPSGSPSLTPTAVPTIIPTSTSTTVPTFDPSATPTTAPTSAPSAVPTANPTGPSVTTLSPSLSPTATLPTRGPTRAPTRSPTRGPTAFVEMGSCIEFAVVAGATVTNGGFSIVNGDLGLSPGSAVTGFPPGEVVGTIHITDSAATSCMADLGIAIADANGRPADATMNGELGGMTLTPGVYKSDGGFAITNTLFLDGENDPEAAWIFIMATSLTVNTGASVVMLNYDYENTTGINVWWSCGERADIFANAAMQGTVMAYQSIAAQNGASSGPLMANIGEVTLLTNVVNSYTTKSNVTVPINPEPTALPTATLTSIPTIVPTASPTLIPTIAPTLIPTIVPTASPTLIPTIAPTSIPTIVPTASPTKQSLYVWNVAGSGVDGFSGDNIVASSAQFSYPFDLWVDTARGDSIYVADSNNHLIRTIDPTTGRVGVYAGTGDLGFQGDGAAATFAKFRYPRGVTGDGESLLFVADTFNNRVRAITRRTTVIRTIAGGGSDTSSSTMPATSANLRSVYGLHFDQVNDFLYFCDAANHVLRRLSVVGGSLSVVAGTNRVSGFSGDGAPATSATMNFPINIAQDTSGNLFVTENDNNCVRKIATDGIISTFAGVCGSTGYAGDGGQATDALFSRPRGIQGDTDRSIYISDAANHRIRVVDTNSNIITTVVGTGSPLFNGNGLLATLSNIRSPFGLSLTADDEIVFTEGNGHKIRGAFSTGPTVSPTAAPTTEAFVAPSALPTATPTAAPTIRDKIVVLLAGKGSDAYQGDGGDAAQASLSSPYGVWLCQNSDILIADNKNHRIRVVDGATNIISTYAGNGVKAFLGDGGPATSASMKFPRQVREYIPGTVFISDCFSHRIRRVLSGTIDTYVGGGSDQTATNRVDVRLRVPQGLFIDDFSDTANHQLYFAESSANVVRKLDMNSGILSIIAGTLNTAGTLSDVQATAAQLSFPFGVYLDSTGVMYVSERDNYAVRRVDTSDGSLTTFAGTVGVSGFAGDGLDRTSAIFSTAVRGVWGDIEGNIYVSDTNNQRIRKIRPDGIILTEVGTGRIPFNGNGLLASETNIRTPMGIYVTPGGEVYFAEAEGNSIRAALYSSA